MIRGGWGKRIPSFQNDQAPKNDHLPTDVESSSTKNEWIVCMKVLIRGAARIISPNVGNAPPPLAGKASPPLEVVSGGIGEAVYYDPNRNPK